MQDLWLMHRDEKVGYVRNFRLEACREDLLPLYLKNTENVAAWLAMRAIDEHRTNSRLLKKALHLANRGDITPLSYSTQLP